MISSFRAKSRKDVYHFATFGLAEGRDNPKMAGARNDAGKGN